MSIQAVAWALEQDLPARPKLVLVAIANHANHVDGFCWLKAETIAKESSCTPRSVYRFVGGLVRNGYIRKAPKRGADGKQRANDYWLLLDRTDAGWDWGAELEEDGNDPVDVEGEDAAEVEAATSSDVSSLPRDRISHGSDDSAGIAVPVDKHAVSCGPSDNRVSRQESLASSEPSKPNPKSPARDPALAAATRSYRPPPPQPIAADQNLPTKQIFVYAGTPAYDAWARRMAAQNRTSSWSLTTRANVNGEWRHGWYFPTLFPPTERPKAAEGSPSTGPPHAA